MPIVLEELWQQSPELGWALAVYALALPLEQRWRPGRSPAWTTRLGNLGAMLLNFAVGGALLIALMTSPLRASLPIASTPARFALLDNAWLWAFAFLLVHDGLYYVYHRLQHAVPLFWRFHALHHSDEAVNITTSRRTHFLERPLQALLLTLPTLLLLGVHPEGLVIALPVTAFFLYSSHLDLRLGLGPLTTWLVGPQYHRIHHARDRSDRALNYAQLFPVFDRLGGTCYRPEPSEYPETGVEGLETPAQRWRPLLY